MGSIFFIFVVRLIDIRLRGLGICDFTLPVADDLRRYVVPAHLSLCVLGQIRTEVIFKRLARENRKVPWHISYIGFGRPVENIQMCIRDRLIRSLYWSA